MTYIHRHRQVFSTFENALKAEGVVMMVSSKLSSNIDNEVSEHLFFV